MLTYSLSQMKEKKFELNYSQRELLGGFNQKSGITVIMFGKDEFGSASSKRGKGGRAFHGSMPGSIHICELSPWKLKIFWLLV